MTTPAATARGNGNGLTYAVLAWAVAYGGLRLAWTAGEAPEFPPFGSDLLGFTGWRSVALCLAAGVAAVALDRASTWRPMLAGFAWALTGALVAAAAILLPELVSLLLFAPGPSFDPVAFASRLGCVTGAALLGLATARYQRRTRGDCPDCCRTVRPGLRRSAPAPWARWAAYVAVAGLVTRFAAQAVVDLDGLTRDASMIGLEIGLVLAGALLPLALVQHWGEVWPRWVPLLAGRTIPRRLLLVPGFGLGAGIVAYFGMGLAQLATGSASEFSDTFLWVAMSAYCLLGLGLLAASSDYHLRTRDACRSCGR
ncbi:hypothetical protein [Micromonospora lupini]|uniref:Uncharacterized protein n=1 Tax=Micromonospora lupini str. Lupac 08 TaxID=1150864 RepID=I0L709_9ACTN|nr:hypothetical protein [Micromonospora lupini]CCH19606.1 Conserved membrane hypothetical protein [Micromonospora lupini str. Lupac 08]